MFRCLAHLSVCLLGFCVMAESALGVTGLKVVVILDNSGSMKSQMRNGGSRIKAAKQALLTVLDQTPDSAEVGVILINHSPRDQWLIPLGPVDRSSFRRAVNRITADGPTPLGLSLKLAADALLEVRETQRYGTYKILVVTDGEATDGYLVDRYLPEIQSRGILMDVIGVAMQGELRLAQNANTYRRADDPKSLEKAISKVVLGESDEGMDDNSGESDFEILAPLPEEVAIASLAALTSRPNTPITGPREDIEGPANQGRVDGALPNQHVAQENGMSIISIIFVVAMVLIVALKAGSGSIGKR